MSRNLSRLFVQLLLTFPPKALHAGQAADGDENLLSAGAENPVAGRLAVRGSIQKIS